jgi:uncharacterized membrane protein YdcZ (DUF606 family)
MTRKDYPRPERWGAKRPRPWWHWVVFALMVAFVISEVFHIPFGVVMLYAFALDCVIVILHACLFGSDR